MSETQGPLFVSETRNPGGDWEVFERHEKKKVCDCEWHNGTHAVIEECAVAYVPGFEDAHLFASAPDLKRRHRALLDAVRRAHELLAPLDCHPMAAKVLADALAKEGA